MVLRNNRRNWVAVFPPLNIWWGLVRSEGQLKKTQEDRLVGSPGRKWAEIGSAVMVTGRSSGESHYGERGGRQPRSVPMCVAKLQTTSPASTLSSGKSLMWLLKSLFSNGSFVASDIDQLTSCSGQTQEEKYHLGEKWNIAESNISRAHIRTRCSTQKYLWSGTTPRN